MKFLLCFFFWPFISLAWPSGQGDIDFYLTKIQNENEISSRLDLASKLFMKSPYAPEGPLGEGEKGRFDQDPLYRFDTFDCTTYIETVISLALAHSPNDFTSIMRNIRYEDGEIDYFRRNHFPSLQWIPRNVENGLLAEINHTIVPSHQIKSVTSYINFPNWLRAHKIEKIKIPYADHFERLQRLKELQLMADHFSIQEANIEYIPIELLVNKSELLNKIPNGSIINFVRPNWDLTAAIGTHLNVSHQGFIFYKNGIPMLRHATPTDTKNVTEINLLEYLKKFVGHSTLKGVHFMSINQAW